MQDAEITQDTKITQDTEIVQDAEIMQDTEIINDKDLTITAVTPKEDNVLKPADTLKDPVKDVVIDIAQSSHDTSTDVSIVDQAQSRDHCVKESIEIIDSSSDSDAVEFEEVMPIDKPHPPAIQLSSTEDLKQQPEEQSVDQEGVVLLGEQQGVVVSGERSVSAGGGEVIINEEEIAVAVQEATKLMKLPTDQAQDKLREELEDINKRANQQIRRTAGVTSNMVHEAQVSITIYGVMHTPTHLIKLLLFTVYVGCQIKIFRQIARYSYTCAYF